MHPILFRLGSTIIYTYTILLDVGLVCGLVVACLEGKRRGIAPERIVDAALWAVVAGIVGGRVGYVLANQEYFAENLREAFYIWKGDWPFKELSWLDYWLFSCTAPTVSCPSWPWLI